eukprot:GHVR01068006.1.p1 GENE.GHVR01068006.1~~GHVR01068006.1.p1  ORF type:complete len:274 (+),score=104.44 GHVR01068006.1:51-824(+)
METVQPGKVLPSVPLFRADGKTHDPCKHCNFDLEFATGRHALFGVPGVFLKQCEAKHARKYEWVNQQREKMVVSIVVVDSAEAVVVWTKAIAASQRGVRVYADPTASVARWAGVAVDMTGVGSSLGGIRCKCFFLNISSSRVVAIESDSDTWGGREVPRSVYLDDIDSISSSEFDPWGEPLIGFPHTQSYCRHRTHTHTHRHFMYYNETPTHTHTPTHRSLLNTIYVKDTHRNKRQDTHTHTHTHTHTYTQNPRTKT